MVRENPLERAKMLEPKWLRLFATLPFILFNRGVFWRALGSLWLMLLPFWYVFGSFKGTLLVPFYKCFTSVWQVRWTLLVFLAFHYECFVIYPSSPTFPPRDPPTRSPLASHVHSSARPTDTQARSEELAKRNQFKSSAFWNTKLLAFL